MTDDKIKKLDVRFKRPIGAEGKFLTLVPKYEGCLEHSYVIDPEADKVTCRKCLKIFNPMAVLTDLARKESGWFLHHQRYTEEMKRLDEKSRTKCEHCKQMTRIR